MRGTERGGGVLPQRLPRSPCARALDPRPPASSDPASRKRESYSMLNNIKLSDSALVVSAGGTGCIGRRSGAAKSTASPKPLALSPIPYAVNPNPQVPNPDPQTRQSRSQTSRKTRPGRRLTLTRPIPERFAILDRLVLSLDQNYTFHPSSYTPHPSPYALHPSPYTLHPSPPFTLHPTRPRPPTPRARGSRATRETHRGRPALTKSKPGRRETSKASASSYVRLIASCITPI